MKFNATAGGSYTIETSELGDLTLTPLYLYDTDGTTVIDEDDGSGVGWASKIVWNCSVSGTYYIRVLNPWTESCGPEMQYDISVTVKPTPPLRGDVNSDGAVTSADAAIVLNLTVRGEYRTAADVSDDGKVSSLDALMILQMAIGGT